MRDRQRFSASSSDTTRNDDIANTQLTRPFGRNNAKIIAWKTARVKRVVRYRLLLPQNIPHLSLRRRGNVRKVARGSRRHRVRRRQRYARAKTSSSSWSLTRQPTKPRRRVAKHYAANGRRERRNRRFGLLDDDDDDDERTCTAPLPPFPDTPRAPVKTHGFGEGARRLNSCCCRSLFVGFS